MIRSLPATATMSTAAIGIDTYDEYGRPGASNIGRFQYTGQKWIPEIGAYDYKARIYLLHLGIFAQTDPIRQAGGPNLYPYVGDDPVNAIDPLGEDVWCSGEYATVCGKRLPENPNEFPAREPPSPGRAETGSNDDPIYVTGKRPTKPIYCYSFVYIGSRKVQQFGEGLSNFAGGVIGAGLVGKVPPVVESGETIGAFGVAFQSLGVLGKFVMSGNTSVARLDAINVLASFLKSQTQAARLASGYTMGAAVGEVESAYHVDPCG